jgi:hypothetical protein
MSAYKAVGAYVILRSCRTFRLVVVICEPRKRPVGEARICDG